MTRPAVVKRFAVIALSLGFLAVSACGGAQARKIKHLEKGDAFMVQGNFEKARVEFRNALQIAPNDAEARFDNGLVDEELGNVREAAQFYQGAIDANPDHVRARASLARLFLFSGAPDRAMELIRPGLDKHPDDAELLTIRAAGRAQQKDPTGALADAERAVQLSPLNEDSIAVLAGLYSSSGNTVKAQQLLAESIKKNPNTVDLRVALAQLYSGQNRTAETESLLLDLVRLKPNDKAHRIRLAQYYAGLNQIDPAERVLRDGVKSLPAERDLKTALIDFLASRRSRDVAEKELKSMIAANPKDPELEFALARFHEQGRESAKAEAVYRSVIDTEKLDAAGLTARDRLAALRVQSNDIPGTLKLVNEVLTASPRDNDALILRGNIALAQQDPKAAIADMRAVLRDQPNATGVLRTLARAHLANGEPAIAEETLRRAVDANPKDFQIKLDFAELLAQLGRPEQAKPVVAEVVKQDPGNLAALDAEFKIAAAVKDYATSKSAAEAIVALNPKAAMGYFYQGLIAEAEKRNDDALRLYGKAIELQPDAAEPLQAQIKLLVSAKRIAEAIKRLDDIAARFPGNAVAPHFKGELLLAQKNIPGAKAEFNKAIGRAPKWSSPYRGLAYAQLGANDASAAIETLRNGERAVDQPEILGAELAALLDKLGRPDEAMREYEAMIRRNPKSDVAMNNLAMLLATYKKDSASLDRAKALSARFADSSNPSFLDTYGWVLFKRGEAAASVPVLEKVVAQNPDAAVARYHLGMAQSSVGSNSQARENLTRAINSGVKFAGLDEAKATLDKLAKLSGTAAAPKS